MFVCVCAAQMQNTNQVRLERGELSGRGCGERVELVGERKCVPLAGKCVCRDVELRAEACDCAPNAQLKKPKNFERRDWRAWRVRTYTRAERRRRAAQRCRGSAANRATAICDPWRSAAVATQATSLREEERERR